jgi:phosphatidylglycerophosphate synthase
MSAQLSPQRWSAWHAGAMLLGLALSCAVGKTEPLALSCVASLAGWVWSARGAFENLRAFGAANSVTSLRVLSLACLGAAIDARAALACSLCSLGIFTLDGVDGWLARRADRASAFGAYYDSETDACFVLVLSLGMFQFGRAGAWVLLAGALRYLYLLTLWFSQRQQVEAPRSRFGRYTFALVVSAFTLGVWPAARVSQPLAAAATLLLTYSFARSFYWSLRVERTFSAPR